MINIDTIVNSFKNIFNSGRKPAPSISGLLLVCGIAQRPGLSTIVSTANVLQELKKNGIPTEEMADGSPNLMNKYTQIMIAEIYRAIQEDMKIQVGLEPGSVTITGSGGNAGGPVAITGTNVGYGKGYGQAQ